MTIDQGADMDRYQGVTPLRGASLAEAAMFYFEQSEQIPTVVKLAVGRLSAPGRGEQWRAGGVMAQYAPGEGRAREGDAEILTRANEEDLWTRIAALTETTQDDELLDPAISAERLLYRLFHEDGVRVFSPQHVRAACSCDADGIAAVLKCYSPAELADMVESGAINVTCEFCRKIYHFTPDGDLMSAP
jgi:molecular chaperone Hsp33